MSGLCFGKENDARQTNPPSFYALHHSGIAAVVKEKRKEGRKEEMSLALAVAALTPPLLRGMKVLDKAAFNQKISLWALKVPSKECGTYLETLKGYSCTLYLATLLFFLVHEGRCLILSLFFALQSPDQYPSDQVCDPQS